jgi:hypothetical protein
MGPQSADDDRRLARPELSGLRECRFSRSRPSSRGPSVLATLVRLGFIFGDIGLRVFFGGLAIIGCF